MVTVAETAEFLRKSKRLLTESEHQRLICHLSEHPLAGIVIEGAGGIRKLRWPRQSKGKSGGLRIIYFFYNETFPLYMLTIYSKGQKENLSPEERNELAKLVDILVDYWKR